MRGKLYDEDDIQRLGEIIAEYLASEFKTGLEALDEIKRQVTKIPAIEDHISVLQDDVKAIKAVLKITNKDVQRHARQLDNHDKRISHLEVAHA